MTPTCPEPRLDQLLNDPLVRLVMRSDRVEEEEVRQLAARIAPTLRPRSQADLGRCG
jgi:hypothetical protein